MRRWRKNKKVEGKRSGIREGRRKYTKKRGKTVKQKRKGCDWMIKRLEKYYKA